MIFRNLQQSKHNSLFFVAKKEMIYIYLYFSTSFAATIFILYDVFFKFVPGERLTKLEMFIPIVFLANLVLFFKFIGVIISFGKVATLRNEKIYFNSRWLNNEFFLSDLKEISAKKIGNNKLKNLKFKFEHYSIDESFLILKFDDNQIKYLDGILFLDVSEPSDGHNKI